MVPLGNSGWTASWSSGLDSKISLEVVGENADTVFLRQTSLFDSGSAGFIEPYAIVFSQTRSDATDFIAIDSMTITNQTDADWYGFKFTLFNASLLPDFDAQQTNIGQAGGFSIEPFTQHEYSADQRMLIVSGGFVPNEEQAVSQFLPLAVSLSSTWTPGETSGALWINAEPTSGPYRVFTFKQQPLTAVSVGIPEPASLGLVGAAMLSLRRRRK